MDSAKIFSSMRVKLRFLEKDLGKLEKVSNDMQIRFKFLENDLDKLEKGYTSEEEWDKHGKKKK